MAVDDVSRFTPSDLGIGILFEAINEAVVVADAASDRILLWNPAAERLLGYTAAEATGMRVNDLVPQPYKERHLEGMRRYAETGHGRLVDGKIPFEMPALAKDGREVRVEMTLSPVPAKGASRSFVLAVMRDVTERERVRAETERLQADRIRALEEAQALKDQFISILSHELRTPINAITGFGSLLEDEVAGPLTPTQHAYLGKMLKGADTLLSLINDLLDMSRIQAGRFSLQLSSFRLDEVVASVVDNLSPLAEQKQIRLHSQLPAGLPEIVGDAARITQVLLNLVSNALKFTAPGGEVAIRVSEAGEVLRCDVVDTGIGIAPEDLPKLFKPFSQVDMTSTRRVGGTGLGLSISKALVEAHGGQIGVESITDEGSTFWFTLPKAGPPPERG